MRGPFVGSGHGGPLVRGCLGCRTLALLRSVIHSGVDGGPLLNCGLGCRTCALGLCLLLDNIHGGLPKLLGEPRGISALLRSSGVRGGHGSLQLRSGLRCRTLALLRCLTADLDDSLLHIGNRTLYINFNILVVIVVKHVFNKYIRI